MIENRLIIHLSDEDFTALIAIARLELRSTKDQAAYLLHLALANRAHVEDKRLAHDVDNREAKPL